jgi:hypothetical protein
MTIPLSVAVATSLLLSVASPTPAATKPAPGLEPAAASKAAPPPPALAAPGPDEQDEPGAPVRGSAEDLALWRSLRDDWHQLIIERAAAHKLYYQLRPEQETARMLAVEKEHPELVPTVGPLQKRLAAARGAQYQIMSQRWPIDPRRGCRVEMDALASAMDASAAPGGQEGAESARVYALICTEKLRSVLAALKPANVELQAAVAEVNAFLAKAPPPAAAPGAVTGPGKVPGASGTADARETRKEVAESPGAVK